MSIRKIPLTRRSLGGRTATRKAQSSDHESALERDYLKLLEFDFEIGSFEVQPVSVPYIRPDGVSGTYVPDVLAQYRRDVEATDGKRDFLCEVKYRRDLRAKWRQLRPRFRAAARYARERGWRFRLMTEVEIRTPLLENAKFLLPYRRLTWDEGIECALMERMRVLRECEPRTLTGSFFSDPWREAGLLPQIWRLVSLGRLGADLSSRLTMRSRIWTMER